MEILKETASYHGKAAADCGDLGIPEVYATKTLREHENSIDALCVNPMNANSFASGSHDHTIKLWDAPNFKSKATLKGHAKGVWSLTYNHDGTKLASASPDMSAKIWDVKSGKCTATVRGHDLFCYKANFSSDGTQLVTCGADAKLNQWDLRNTTKPLWSIQDSKHCLMCCDFFNDDTYIIASNIEGELFLYSTERQKLVWHHDTMPGILEEYNRNKAPNPADVPMSMTPNQKAAAERVPTNIIYLVKGLKNAGEENCFFVGSQDTNLQKIKKDFDGISVTEKFVGHSSGIRSAELNKDATKLLTGCEDHSLRVWDYKTATATHLLAGHSDVVTGGVFLNDKTVVTSSWDMTMKVWQI